MAWGRLSSRRGRDDPTTPRDGPPALRHVFLHCVIFATPLRCIIPLGAGGAVMGWIAIASIIGRGIAIGLCGCELCARLAVGARPPPTSVYDRSQFRPHGPSSNTRNRSGRVRGREHVQLQKWTAHRGRRSFALGRFGRCVEKGGDDELSQEVGRVGRG